MQVFHRDVMSKYHCFESYIKHSSFSEKKIVLLWISCLKDYINYALHFVKKYVVCLRFYDYSFIRFYFIFLLSEMQIYLFFNVVHLTPIKILFLWYNQYNKIKIYSRCRSHKDIIFNSFIFLYTARSVILKKSKFINHTIDK